MDYAVADKLVKELSTGFETLQGEYQKLFGRHEALERKLATARDQYNELAKLYGTGASATPPLSLPSSPSRKKDEAGTLTSVSDILSAQKDQASQDAAKHIRLAQCAVQRLRPGLPNPSSSTAEGVKIWSGPSADVVPAAKSTMPSISESPMEQDFTIEGMPSNLGCPFASMNGKKLSSHAASVLSRYNPAGSAAGAPSSTPLSSVSRVNGRESFNAHRSRRESQSQSHRASLPDPIKAEICGLSDHAQEEAPTEAPVVAKSAVEAHVQSNAEQNVCPIRFLDQHSPEEVATYFENHKHDLPRSHEICVKRYQSNENQIKELDARYGNLVSMIQGLGVKHQPMLPAEPPEDEMPEEVAGLSSKDTEKVRNWANSVSPPPHTTGSEAAAAQDGDGNLADDEGAESDAAEERQGRFARPLRDIRVGESPSRPWGIPVPVKYLEKVEGNASEKSSQPARIPSSSMPTPQPERVVESETEMEKAGKARCPFGFDQAPKPDAASKPRAKEEHFKQKEAKPYAPADNTTQRVTFIAPDAASAIEQKAKPVTPLTNEQSRMVFTGPVFIGYSAEDAAKILRDTPQAISHKSDEIAVELLSQANGYGIIVGLSILFCGIILVAVRIQKRYLAEDSEQSEMFMVANRSVGTGLTCSAVFSSWMWINESVIAAAYTYRWGVALPIWWASGLSFQIALMAVLGIVAKLRVPYAHTSLEFIRIRYGAYAHGIFVVLNLINNIFGCGGMILAGAQLVSGMTGMHIAAAGILIPAGVVIYTAVGGLKATFLTDFLHTTVALILLIYFSLAVLTNEHIGGVYGLYDKVMAAEVYIEGNYAGSLLSAKSRGAILFGLVLKFGNLALVVMDTAFWQKSFASDVNSTVPAYDLASIVILAVPWCTGTIIGLSARAIENNPVWVLYPNTLSATQVNEGLVMPYVLKSLLGRGATAGLLVLIFMAITSTVSSSMIAVSSIISLDFYRTYINPKASDKKTLQVSHIGVIFHGAFMAGFALMLNYAGATNNWSTYFRPIIACPGIFPMMLTILWSGQTKAAAILSPVLGLMSGLLTWFVLSWHWGGAINIQTTQQQLPGLYGAIVSFFSPALFSVAISLAKPSTFDWRIFLKLDLITEKDSTQTPSPSVTQSSTDLAATTDIAENEKRPTQISNDLKPPSPPKSTSADANFSDLDDVVHPMSPETLRHVRKWLRIASIFFVVNVITTLILWPLPLYRDWIFTRSFFGGWVTVAIIWHFAAMGAVIVYPCYDGRHAIATSIRGVVGEIKTVLGKRHVEG